MTLPWPFDPPEFAPFAFGIRAGARMYPPADHESKTPCKVRLLTRKCPPECCPSLQCSGEPCPAFPVFLSHLEIGVVLFGLRSCGPYPKIPGTECLPSDCCIREPEALGYFNLCCITAAFPLPQHSLGCPFQRRHGIIARAAYADDCHVGARLLHPVYGVPVAHAVDAYLDALGVPTC